MNGIKRGTVDASTGKVYWGDGSWVTATRFNEKLALKQQTDAAYRKKQRSLITSQPGYVARTRGERHPETGLIFWGLKTKEEWLTDEEFEKRSAFTKDYLKKNYAENWDDRRKWHQEYNAANPGLKYQRQRKQFENDPVARYRQSLSIKLCHIMKKQGMTKSADMIRIIGCSPEAFKAHIESQFQLGMSWDNHGVYRKDGPVTWHLDHAIELSTAKTIEEAEKLCHHSNLRPLWAPQNIRRKHAAC